MLKIQKLFKFHFLSRKPVWPVGRARKALNMNLETTIVSKKRKLKSIRKYSSTQREGMAISRFSFVPIRVLSFVGSMVNVCFKLEQILNVVNRRKQLYTSRFDTLCNHKLSVLDIEPIETAA